MAKKPVNRKNSRASRRASDTLPELDLQVTSSEKDGKSRVLQQLAERELRKGDKKSGDNWGIEQELAAIGEGTHPDQVNNGTPKVAKASAKKNKRTKRKQERAEILKDILNEKIDLAKKRHKTVRNYRNKDEDEEKS